MPASLVPEDLKVITQRFGLPPVGDVDFTLIRNPLANARSSMPSRRPSWQDAE